MDKSAFKIQSFEEADKQKKYWQSKTSEECLAAANEMIRVAYGYVGKPVPPMDKTAFTIRKRNG